MPQPQSIMRHTLYSEWQPLTLIWVAAPMRGPSRESNPFIYLNFCALLGAHLYIFGRAAFGVAT